MIQQQQQQQQQQRNTIVTVIIFTLHTYSIQFISTQISYKYGAH